MKREVLQTIREHNLLEPDMHIVIGLSGGPDSVCMFDILRELCREMKWTLYPVHINHKLRPGAAEEDQQYVEQMCRKWGIDCHTVIKDCSEMAQKLGKTCEEAGRILRYEAFSTVAAGFSSPSDFIGCWAADNSCKICVTP